MINIAVIVPVHNRKNVTLEFLRQLYEIATVSDGLDLTVIVVDDGSTDNTSQAIRESFPNVVILRGDGNLWWTGAVRKGTEYALAQNQEKLLIMNDDLELDKDFLTELLAVANDNPDALVSSIKLNRVSSGDARIITAGFRIQGRLQEIVAIASDEPYREAMDPVLECDLLTGSSLLIPAKVFRKIGMFDDRNYPHGYGDYEFTRRASIAGFACLVATRSRIYTDYNQNYTTRYLIRSSRVEYLCNLFSRKKFGYGFASLRQIAYLHKPFLLGTALYMRRLIGLFRNVIFKIFLPRRLLRVLVRERHLSDS